jgi:23S rRNA (uracil1939-C5)-methyltransferase
MPTGIIESLDHEARGVTRLDGKTVFVEGALPGESVEYASYRRKPSYELARTLRVLASSAERVTPRCPHFGVCGGCSMQHLDPAAQVAAKQRLLEDNLWHLGRIKADQLYAPIYGQAWGYRYRARLSVRFVLKKGGVLVGFHERKSSYVADMRQCEILPLHLSVLLLPLRELIGQLSIRDRLPQIEVAVGERMTALVLRILEALNPATRPCCANSPTATRWSSTCSRRGRRRPIASIRWKGPGCPTCCRSSRSNTAFRRPSSPRSITRSTACWCAVR